MSIDAGKKNSKQCLHTLSSGQRCRLSGQNGYCHHHRPSGQICTKCNNGAISIEDERPICSNHQRAPIKIITQCDRSLIVQRFCNHYYTDQNKLYGTLNGNFDQIEQEIRFQHRNDFLILSNCLNDTLTLPDVPDHQYQILYNQEKVILYYRREDRKSLLILSRNLTIEKIVPCPNGTVPRFITDSYSGSGFAVLINNQVHSFNLVTDIIYRYQGTSGCRITGQFLFLSRRTVYNLITHRRTSLPKLIEPKRIIYLAPNLKTLVYRDQGRIKVWHRGKTTIIKSSGWRVYFGGCYLINAHRQIYFPHLRKYRTIKNWRIPILINHCSVCSI